MSANALVALLLASALRGAVVLGAVLLCLAITRRVSASARSALLAAGLLVQLTMPIVVSVSARVVPEAAGATIVKTESLLLETLGVTEPTGRAPTSAAGALSSSSFGSMAAGLWAAGVSIVLLWLLFGHARLRRLRRELVPVESGPLRDALDVAAAHVGETRRVTLLVGGPFPVPLTWGIAQPVVMLPSLSTSWSAEQLELALTHELAHVRRGDVALHLIGGVALACFWFQPLVWIARRQQRLTAEYAADDSVLHSGARASFYVDTLVAMVKESQSPRVRNGAMAMARRSEFEGRMLAVLNEHVVRAPAGAGHFARAAIFLGVLSLPLAAFPRPSLQHASALPVSGDPSLEIAATLAGTERGVFLRQLTAELRLDGLAVNRYLTLTRELEGIDVPLTLQTLVRSTTITSHQVDVVLEMISGMRDDVMTATTLAALAQSQTFSQVQRRTYYRIAARLQGGALRTALDALP